MRFRLFDDVIIAPIVLLPNLKSRDLILIPAVCLIRFLHLSVGQTVCGRSGEVAGEGSISVVLQV